MRGRSKRILLHCILMSLVLNYKKKWTFNTNMYVWRRRLVVWISRIFSLKSQLFFKINYLYYFFIFTYRLDVHLVATHHYPKDAYHCELCPKKYCYRPSLLRHRAIIHGEYRKYPCENCSKVSQSTLYF